jgi:SET domain-containing protein
MFKYKTEVKVATNPIMGLGLFAKEFIPKDSIVWEFIDGVDIRITKEKFDTLNEAQKEYFYRYTWQKSDGCYYSSCDLTNFINHSNKPNLKIIDDIVIALVDIEVGDELFENYGEFDFEFDNYKDTFL